MTYKPLLSHEGIELDEGDIINDGDRTFKILHIFDDGTLVIVLERNMMNDGSFTYETKPTYRTFFEIEDNFTVIVKQ